MKAWLFVGAKVVIIQSGASDLADMPTLDGAEVFTIREVVDVIGVGIGVRLVGVIGCTHPIFGRDCPFDANCFGPVSTIDATSQVEALKKLVEPSKLPAKVGS